MSIFVAVRKYGGRSLLGLLVVIGLASILWYRHLQSGDRVSQPPPASTTESAAEMITRGFRHVETKMNRTLWILEASVAEMSGNEANLQRVKITYFGESANPIVITGLEGSVDLGTWNAVLNGNVRAVARDGSVLKTRQLIWSNKAQTLEAPWPVRIHSRDMDLSGRRMTADVEERRVRLTGRVSSLLRPRKGLFDRQDEEG